MKDLWRLAVGAVGVALLLYAGLPAADAWRRGPLAVGENWDFEAGDLSGWTATGTAFERQPTLGDNTRIRQRDSAQQQGHWWIGTYEDYQGRPWQRPGFIHGDDVVGTLTSVPFTITGDRLTFLIGGGDNPWTAPNGSGATAVNLIVGGNVVRSATGADAEGMRREVWDVSDLIGDTAVIELVDHSIEPWGHLNFDDLRQLTRWEAMRGDLLLCLCSGVLLVLLSVSGRFQIWRAALAFTGLLIIGIGAAHDAPWQMRFVRGEWVDGVVWVTFGSTPLAISAAALAACALIVLAGIACARPAARAAIAHCMRQPRRWVVMLIVVGGLALTLMPSRYGWWIVLYLLSSSLGLILVLIGCAPWIERAIAGRGWQRLRRGVALVLDNGAARPVLMGIAFAFVFVAANLGSYVLFDHLPHIEDSIAQDFQAKIFLTGGLTAPLPPIPEAFEFPHVIASERWYSVYLPGHPLVLALGHLASAPWIVNPILGALCVVVLYLIGRDAYDERIGRLALALAALSPFLIFMSSEFMNHTTSLLAIEIFLLGFVRLMPRGRVVDALLAGGGLGWAVLVRPLTALAVAAPFAVYAVARWLQRFGARKQAPSGVWRQAVLYSVALLVVAGAGGGVLLYNDATNGNPFLFGYVVRYGEGFEIGFGHSGWGEPHTPREGVTQTLNNLNALNKYLFEWPIPSLFFVALALMAPRANVWDLLFALYPLALAAAYFFYWFQDWCFGPRFLFEAVAGCVLLTARGMAALPEIFAAYFNVAAPRRVRDWTVAVVLLLFVVGWASNLPALVRLYGNSYWNVNGRLFEAVHEQRVDKAVVFVPPASYVRAFAGNDPLLRAPVIYARDLGAAKNATLMAAFPERTAHVLDDR